MVDFNKISLFGIKIRKKKKEEVENIPTFIAPSNDDGATSISSGNFFSTSLDVEGISKNEVELITRYRDMSVQPEIEAAIEDIISESINFDDNGKNIDIVLDNLEDVSPKIKKVIEDEFQIILKLLNYNNMAIDIFRRWYIDGRLFYHIIIDPENPQKGILELRYIDPRKIKKVREIKKRKDPETGIEIIGDINEYYVYNDKPSNSTVTTYSNTITGIKIAPDSIVFVPSGIMDSKQNIVLSYLFKAIRPLNQLRMMEDASLIYKIGRAPSRRVFYLDVSNLPKQKADQYLKDMMTKYKNKLVYDSATGSIQDQRRHLSMLEDYWIPRRDSGNATEITTLDSNDNFSDMSLVSYFEQKLYKALNVPVGRINPEQTFSLGRTNEITRDELKFSKFIDKLRNKFTELFDQLLRVQLTLKGVCTSEEWEEYKEAIHYDFIKDNNFVELKEAELIQNRLGLLSLIDPFVGRYYTKKWIQQNVLRMNDDEIKKLDKEMNEENITETKKQMELQQYQMELQNEMQMSSGIDQQNQQAQENKPQMNNKNPYNV